MGEDFFNNLEEIYKNFQKEYLLNVKGDCTGCIECCHPPYYMSELEADFLEDFLNHHNIKPDIEAFKAYLVNRESPYCPYANKDKECAIYSARPMGCRTFGIFTFEDREVKLPEGCIFHGRQIKIAEKDRYQIKFIAEFTELKIKYNILHAKDDHEKAEYMIILGEEYMRQNRFSDAISIFKEADKLLHESPWVHFNLACIYIFIQEYYMAGEELKNTLKFGGATEFPELFLEGSLNLAEEYICGNEFSEALSIIDLVREIKTSNISILSRIEFISGIKK
jgi:Fe-S-cluster containining protein